MSSRFQGADRKSLLARRGAGGSDARAEGCSSSTERTKSASLVRRVDACARPVEATDCTEYY